MQAEHYGKVAIWLHWSIAVLVLAQFGTGWTDDLFERGSAPRLYIFRSHLVIGGVILILACVRLVWRLTHSARPLPAGMTGTMAFAAKATHVLLYAVILVQPVLGVLTITAFGKSLGKWPHNLHLVLANLIAVLVALHIAAAFWHHFVRRDGLIFRMLPGRVRARPRPRTSTGL